MVVAKAWQRVEGALVFAACITVFLYLDFGWPWWGAVLVFFSPDLSFAAYLAGPRIGAWGYNIVHIYGFGAVIFAIGAVLTFPIAMAIGLLMLAHSGFDRMFGYGLKSVEGFQQTHLGPIGK